MPLSLSLSYPLPFRLSLSRYLPLCHSTIPGSYEWYRFYVVRLHENLATLNGAFMHIMWVYIYIYTHMILTNVSSTLHVSGYKLRHEIHVKRNILFLNFNKWIEERLAWKLQSIFLLNLFILSKRRYGINIINAACELYLHTLRAISCKLYQVNRSRAIYIRGLSNLLS